MKIILVQVPKLGSIDGADLMNVENGLTEGETVNEQRVNAEDQESSHEISSTLNPEFVSVESAQIVQDSALDEPAAEFTTEIIEEEKTILFIDLNTYPSDLRRDDAISMAIVKIIDGEVSETIDSEDKLNSYFECSVVIGSDLVTGLADIMQRILLPAVQTANSNDDESQTMIPSQSLPTVAALDTHGFKSLQFDLNSNVMRFEKQLRYIVHNFQGDSRLDIPTIDHLPADLKDLTIHQPELLRTIEETVERWTTTLSRAVEKELLKVKEKTKTPLGEIDFWKLRHANLTVYVDQIQSPPAQQILKILHVIDHPLLTNFQFTFDETAKMTFEAKDNVKFLTTLERNFKNLQTFTFRGVIDMLPTMMNGLRMIWVISRHYNTDERMGGLMEMIAGTLVQRVKDEVCV
jgi:hypothetical protein